MLSPKRVRMIYTESRREVRRRPFMQMFCKFPDHLSVMFKNPQVIMPIDSLSACSTQFEEDMVGRLTQNVEPRLIVKISIELLHLRQPRSHNGQIQQTCTSCSLTFHCAVLCEIRTTFKNEVKQFWLTSIVLAMSWPRRASRQVLASKADGREAGYTAPFWPK